MPRLVRHSRNLESETALKAPRPHVQRVAFSTFQNWRKLNCEAADLGERDGMAGTRLASRPPGCAAAKSDLQCVPVPNLSRTRIIFEAETK